MKKNSILILFLFCAVIIQALDQEVETVSADNGISVSIRAKNLDRTFIINTMNDGLRCGIIFEVRLYEKIKAIADKYISATVIEREGKWDPFSKSFLISQNGEFFRFTDSLNDFFEVFLFLDGVNIPFDKNADSEYYILCRIRVETLKFVPPFQILAPGVGIYFPSTSWEKYVIR